MHTPSHPSLTETLLKREDFLRAKRGHKQHMPLLSVQVIANDTGAMRVGLTVSKHCGNAVKRNKIKRRLRQLVRALWPLHGAPGHDYVLIARKEAYGADYSALEQQVTHALRKLSAK